MYSYETVTEFKNLYNGYRKTRKGKRDKNTVAKFEVNSLESILFLQRLLEQKEYRLEPYNVFEVFEPKRRVIMSNSFKDKVVQHSLCDNILEPIYKNKFIYDNCASQKGGGTHFGLDRLSNHLRKHYRKYGAEGWILKCDIEGYFYSIDHDILKKQLRKNIYNEEVLELLDMIIDSVDNPGVPLGNQTSQWFALIYMNELDHFIKRKLKIKGYGRYMDDFYLIHHDKKYLQFCLKEIEREVSDLKMTLNKSTDIFPIRNGIDFLGFHTYITEEGKIIRKLRRKSKSNMRRKLRRLKKKYNDGEVELYNIIQSFESWKGHAQHGNCYYLIRDMEEYFESLFKEAIEKEERRDINGENDKGSTIRGED